MQASQDCGKTFARLELSMRRMDEAVVLLPAVVSWMAAVLVWGVVIAVVVSIVVIVLA